MGVQKHHFVQHNTKSAELHGTSMSNFEPWLDFTLVDAVAVPLGTRLPFAEPLILLPRSRSYHVTRLCGDIFSLCSPPVASITLQYAVFLIKYLVQLRVFLFDGR
jgi:hypothetical protein